MLVCWTKRPFESLFVFLFFFNLSGLSCSFAFISLLGAIPLLLLLGSMLFNRSDLCIMFNFVYLFFVWFLYLAVSCFYVLFFNFSDKSYSKGNRLKRVSSSYPFSVLAPRCRLILFILHQVCFWESSSLMFFTRAGFRTA